MFILSHIFLDLFPEFSGIMLKSDVPVDNEVTVVTSRIPRSAGAQSFRGAHRGRVCICVFIGVSVRACRERLRCTVNLKKCSYYRFKKNVQILPMSTKT
jgi:hypothetical protein